MSSSSSNVMHATKSPFLALPLEIRFMIYNLVMPSQPGKGRVRSYICGDGGRIRRAGHRMSCGEKDDSVVDQGLCLASRQIYIEMEHLLHINPIRITISGGLSYGKFETSTPLEALLRNYDWVQSNTKEVRLQLSPAPCRTTAVDSAAGEVKRNKYQDVEKELDLAECQRLICEFWRAFFCICYCISKKILSHDQTQISLQPVAQILSTLPKLETIDLLWPPSSSASNTWSSFWSDIKGLVALNATCSVQIVVANENDIIDLFWFLREHDGRLLMTSTWQYGEHSFGEGDVESKTWRRTGLDAGLRWENRWRIVEGREAGGMSVDVLVRAT